MVRRWLVICVGAWLASAATAVAQPPGLGSPLVPRVTPPESPTARYPLGTDGLMDPAPAVPPRTSFQVPTAPPVPPPQPEVTLPDGTPIRLPESVTRQFRFGPRYGRPISFSTELLPEGTRRWVVTGGLIVNVSYGNGADEIEFATDEAVVWVKGLAADNALAGFQTDPDQKTEVELYLTGNVVIRTQSKAGPLGGGTVTQTLRAQEIYYDVNKNRAVALSADLEMTAPHLPDAVHMTGREIDRLDLQHWEALGASVYSSALPSDPGLRLDSSKMQLTERRVVRRNIFGIPYRTFGTWEKELGYERILTLRGAVTRVDGLPVFYLPYMRLDANDPLGPLSGISFGQSRMFGTAVYTTWDVYKLIALRPPPGHSWKLHLDYLSGRGPAAGTDYDYVLQPTEPGLPSPGRGYLRYYGINDKRPDDVIGGSRGEEPVHPNYRNRFQWRHQQEILEGMYFQGQVAYLSDKNFFEQFYKNEFDFGPNQETFAYLTWQRGNWWASGLVEDRFHRQWETETNWLPRLDGALVGQSFFDLFNYNARASGAYAQLKPAEINPYPVLFTDRPDNTGRFDLYQELSLPFQLGAFKLAPYGVLDLTYYSRDLFGEERGRAYGGGGVRGSIPFSRLYPDAYSELFNVRGINHKVVFGANYYHAQSNTPYYYLPQLDRLNDDQIDRTYRNIRPFEPQFYPGPTGLALANSPVFNIQQYAIRRLVDNRVDTLDDIHVLQGDIRQRFQTKRGYPGFEHTVDVLTLDVSGSFFPNPSRDNYGKSFAFLEYAALWNVGDRVSLSSTGWYDPFDYGARYYTVGAYLDRPDRTNFYFGYRHTDPINSRQVTASVGYQISRRYYANASVSYDFGIQQALSNTFSLTRTGSDVTVSIGVNYNALVNNFGVQFLVIPNIAAFSAPGRFAGTQLFGR